MYGLFPRWQRGGVWAQILTALQALADAVGAIVWDISVDSAIGAANRCRSWSPPVSVGTVRITAVFDGISVPRADRVPGRILFWPTRHTAAPKPAPN